VNKSELIAYFSKWTRDRENQRLCFEDWIIFYKTVSPVHSTEFWGDFDERSDVTILLEDEQCRFSILFVLVFVAMDEHGKTWEDLHFHGGIVAYAEVWNQ